MLRAPLNRITGFQPVPEVSGVASSTCSERPQHGLETRDTATARTKAHRSAHSGREKPKLTPVLVRRRLRLWARSKATLRHRRYDRYGRTVRIARQTLVRRARPCTWLVT